MKQFFFFNHSPYEKLLYNFEYTKRCIEIEILSRIDKFLISIFYFNP